MTAACRKPYWKFWLMQTAGHAFFCWEGIKNIYKISKFLCILNPVVKIILSKFNWQTRSLRAGSSLFIMIIGNNYQ